MINGFCITPGHYINTVQVVCLGELLIDFVSLESGVSLEQAPAFKKAPGGAPANVAVGLVKLGHQVGFVGKVGQESFGEFGAITATKHGAIPSLPTRAEVEEFMKRHV
jgi:sugar/nucleoside kinase (ribokinase family)